MNFYPFYPFFCSVFLPYQKQAYIRKRAFPAIFRVMPAKKQFAWKFPALPAMRYAAFHTTFPDRTNFYALKFFRMLWFYAARRASFAFNASWAKPESFALARFCIAQPAAGRIFYWSHIPYLFSKLINLLKFPASSKTLRKTGHNHWTQSEASLRMCILTGNSDCIQPQSI